MPPKYAIQWGSAVWHKKSAKFKGFYRKYGIRTPQKYGIRTPPFLPYELFLLVVGVLGFYKSQRCSATKKFRHEVCFSLKTLTSLNKKVRPLFLVANTIWRVITLSLPLAIAAFGGPEGYSSLAIIAFGAFVFVVPKYEHRL